MSVLAFLWREREREKEREREREMSLLFHLYIHSLVYSCTWPVQGSNLQPWFIGMIFQPTEILSQGTIYF